MYWKLAILLVCVLVSGCLYDWRGKEDSTFFKGIEWAIVPEDCANQADNVCALYDCMVDRCWCHYVGPDGAILKEGETPIKTEEEAIDIVREYTQEYDVQRAVKMNNIFFNVFAYDESGTEEVYTVAVDGTILVTRCGV